MNTVVVDASALLRAVYPTEAGHSEAQQTMERLLAAGVEPIAPDLLPYEVGHALRRTSGDVATRARLLLDALELVELSPLRLDDHAHALTLAGTSGLSFYDAAYVVLANRQHTLLWTEDREIVRRQPQIAMGAAAILARIDGP
jgi:predicted nucleic acid-binding protein